MKEGKKEMKNVAAAEILGRGRTFEGFVKKKFPKRIVVEFERTVYVPKYESYYRKKTKLHARVPENMENEIKIGDLVRIQECRPLSKIIHFILVEKIRDADLVKEKGK